MAALGALLGSCRSPRGTASTGPQAGEAADRPVVERICEEGIALLEAGRLAEAKEALDRAVATEPAYAPAHNNLGLVLLRQGDYYRAAWEFHVAANRDPEAADPPYNLGVLYQNIGREPEAIRYYEKALSLDGRHLAGMQNLALLYARLNIKPKETLELAREIALRDSSEAWQSWTRAQMLRLNRGASEAPGTQGK